MSDAEDDAHLVAAALANDANAFTRLMRRHKDAIYRFVRRYVGDSDEAFDLVQETFVSAWAALGKFDTTRPLPAWLKRIALNKCRDWSRRRTVRQFFFRALSLDSRHVEVSEAVADAIDDEGRFELLDRAIASLPANLKEPLILTAFDGMSHREAAELLQITPKAIETRIYRARQELAKVLHVPPRDVEG